MSKIYEHKIYYSKNTCSSGQLHRILKVKILGISGKLKNVPIDKTYQNNGRKYVDGKWVNHQVYLKLEVEEKGLMQQRLHYLYLSSKNGYYCVVCNQKCYFDKEDILKLVNEVTND